MRATKFCPWNQCTDFSGRKGIMGSHQDTDYCVFQSLSETRGKCLPGWVYNVLVCSIAMTSIKKTEEEIFCSFSPDGISNCLSLDTKNSASKDLFIFCYFVCFQIYGLVTAFSVEIKKRRAEQWVRLTRPDALLSCLGLQYRSYSSCQVSFPLHSLGVMLHLLPAPHCLPSCHWIPAVPGAAEVEPWAPRPSDTWWSPEDHQTHKTCQTMVYKPKKWHLKKKKSRPSFPLRRLLWLIHHLWTKWEQPLAVTCTFPYNDMSYIFQLAYQGSLSIYAIQLLAFSTGCSLGK